MRAKKLIQSFSYKVLEISFLWFLQPISAIPHINSTKVKKFSHGLLLQVNGKVKNKTKQTVSSLWILPKSLLYEKHFTHLTAIPRIVFQRFLLWTFLPTKYDALHDIFCQDLCGVAKSLLAQVKNDLSLKIKQRKPEIYPHKQKKSTPRVQFFCCFKEKTSNEQIL